MILLKKRNCPECRGEMRPQLINILYKKAQSDIWIEVIDIPANVCTQCYDRVIPGKVAKYIDSLVDPIFESEMHQTEKVLPASHIDIQPVERTTYDYA